MASTPTLAARPFDPSPARACPACGGVQRLRTLCGGGSAWLCQDPGCRARHEVTPRIHPCRKPNEPAPPSRPGPGERETRPCKACGGEQELRAFAGPRLAWACTGRDCGVTEAFRPGPPDVG